MNTKVDHDNLYAMRHSLAHIMATAIGELWPEAKFGVGPVIENGFYYDVDLKQSISGEDFGKIEAKMREVIKADYPFERTERGLSEAIKFVTEQKQPYKVELLKDLEKHGTTVARDIDRTFLGAQDNDAKITTVSFYKDGPFEDLCRGPHVQSTSKVGAFKLTKVSGAYWRGDDKNPQMQRIYGVAFESQKELDDYFAMVEEAEKRDHRKLGKELDLFVFSDLIGPGLPLWTPRGTVLRRQLDNYVQELRDEHDYQEVFSPHLTKKDAYIKSGHWKKFEHELFRIKTREGHELAVKPMNCPHHTQIYDSRPRSYRELPLRYRETATTYRDEQSGELSGLERVRAITMDDAHVFARTVQIEQEVLKVWDIIDRFYKTFNFPLQIRFSSHDPQAKEAYMGDSKAWQSAEAQMRKIVEAKVGKDYIDGTGEAAFYGPKIDFMGKDALGRVTQVATIQLDFNQPEGFDLNCINENGDKERIVMIHAAIMGSIDRFLSVLIEHYGGKFPVWLAPEQIRIATVSEAKELSDFAAKLRLQLKAAGLRAEVDLSNESVGKKIRAAEMMKVPYTLVIGEKELKSGNITPRLRADLGEGKEMAIDTFIDQVAQQVKARSVMAKPVLAVDIDDVLLISEPALADYYNRQHGTNIASEDLYDGIATAAEALGHNRQEVIDSIESFLLSHEFTDIAPMEKAINSIERLKQRYDLITVTGRGSYMEKQTITWLKQHFPNTFQSVHIIGSPRWGEGFDASKLPIFQQHNVSVVVDDSLGTCLKAAAAGINVLLFGDYPWNQADQLPDNVTRVKDWDEVIKVLLKS